MKKVLAALAAAGLMLGFGAAAASAAPAADENGARPNDHGQCTAYFNGQKVGHGDGENPDSEPPQAQTLTQTGENFTNNDGVDNDRDGKTDADDSPPESTELTDAENVFNYCENSGPLSMIGGSPEHGRFTCSNDGTDIPQDAVTNPDSNTDPECTRNEKPGNG